MKELEQSHTQCMAFYFTTIAFFSKEVAAKKKKAERFFYNRVKERLHLYKTSS
jgi:hypothetical protein